MSTFIGKFTNIIRILMMTTVVIDDRRISLLTIDFRLSLKLVIQKGSNLSLNV